MIRLALESDFAWWASQPGLCALTPKAIGVVALVGDAVAGMAVLDRIFRTSADAHICVPRPARVRLLPSAFFSLAFGELELEVLLGSTPGDRPRALKLARQLGFIETHRVPNGAGLGVDLVLSELHRDACRWLAQSREAA
jgi:hypothetical protein